MWMMSRRFVLAALLSVVLVSGLGVAGCDDSSQGDGQSAQAEPVVITMFVRGALNQIVGAFEEGQEVRIKDSGTVVGTITAVEIVPSATAAPTSEGELREANSPVFSDVTLTIEGEAIVSDKGYQFDGRYLYINDEISYLTPVTHFLGMVISMEPTP